MSDDLFSKAARGLFNAITGGHDFRNDDVVVLLPNIGAPEGMSFAYVGNDGRGKIEAFDTEDLEEAREFGLGNFVRPGDLARAGNSFYARELAQKAVDVIERNSDLQPYDLGEDGVFEPKSIAELGDMLRHVRREFNIEDTPLLGEKFGDPERQAVYQAKLHDYDLLGDLIDDFDTIEQFPKYLEDLMDDAAKKLSHDSVHFLQGEIEHAAKGATLEIAQP